MTPYETQSLAVAWDTYRVYFWADIIAGFALLTIIVGGVIAYLTLKAIVRQLKTAQGNALLSFEQDMANRRAKFSEVAAKLDANSTALETKSYEEAKESYFNS